MLIVSDFSPDGIKSAKLRDLYGYWNKLRGDRFAPSRSIVGPSAIPKLLPYICLVEALRSPQRFRFRLAGTEIVDYYGEEMTGKLLQDLDLNDHSLEIGRDYHRVVQTNAPTLQTYQFTKNSGQWLNYERILLPLSENGTSVTVLLFGGYPLSFEEKCS